jgi:hypothetical protein
MSNAMADLEKLAVQRDRGFLVRLVLGLAVAALLSVFIFRGLTGKETSGCMADVLLGGDVEPPARTP